MEKRSLGKEGTKLISALERRGALVVTIPDVCRITGWSRDKAKILMHKLSRKGWFERIERGKYLYIPIRAIEGKWAEYPWLIVPNLVEDYYISYITAMSFWGFTEQIPVTVYVATTKQKKEIEFQNYVYKFVKLAPYKFFGWQEIELKGGYTLNMASKEKTIVDCFDKPKYCLGIDECAKALYNARRQISTRKLTDYALRMRNKTLVKRLGYVMDLLGMDVPKKLEKLVRNDKKYVPLDPLGKAKGSTDKKWKIIKNMEEEYLLSFLEGF